MIIKCIRPDDLKCYTNLGCSIVINLRIEDRLAHVSQTTPPTRLNAIFRKR